MGVYLEEGQLTSVRGAHPTPRPRVRAESYIYVDHVLVVKYMCLMLMFTRRPRATSFHPNARHSPRPTRLPHARADSDVADMSMYALQNIAVLCTCVRRPLCPPQLAPSPAVLAVLLLSYHLVPRPDTLQPLPSTLLPLPSALPYLRFISPASRPDTAPRPPASSDRAVCSRRADSRPC